MNTYRVPATPAKLSWLATARAKSLSVLDMSHPWIGDDELRFIRHLDGLEKLWLTTSSVTDEGIQFLSNLTSLKELSLAGAPITDDSIQYILELESLWYLNLAFTAVTESGLLQLLQAPGLNLRRLDVTGTAILASTLRAIELYRPDLHISAFVGNHGRIGRYELESSGHIGDSLDEVDLMYGGLCLGLCYEARDTVSGAAVVLDTFDASTQSYASWIFEEAKRTAALRSPSVLQILDVQWSPRTVRPVHAQEPILGQKLASYSPGFVVLERVKGETLARTISTRGPLSVSETVSIAVRVAEALLSAREVGIQHGQLNSGKVVLAPDNELKVAGFGIYGAGRLPPGDPESFLATPDTDALGHIIIAMLSGDPGYAAHRWMHEQFPEDLMIRRPDIPDWLERILRQSLSGDAYLSNDSSYDERAERVLRELAFQRP